MKTASLPKLVYPNQLRVLNKTRLTKKLGEISPAALEKIETCVLFTLGIKI